MMENNWYSYWVPGATIDDQMWHQSLVVDRVLESLRGSRPGPNDDMMWTLIQRGILDMDSDDTPVIVTVAYATTARLFSLFC